MKMLPEQMRQNKYNSLIKRLAKIIHSAKATAVRQINKAQALAYYEIGREIVEFEQKGKARAGYGEALITRLSIDMTKKFGKGFSEMNLRNMRRFYLEFPMQIQQTVSVKSLEKNKFQTVSGKSSIRQTPSAEFEPMLSWSHYCELLSVENPFASSFYEQESINNNWSFRELKRQINSQLFERLALSKNTKAVMKLAKEKGNIGTLPVLLFLLLGTTSFLGYIASHLLTAFKDNRNIFKNRAMLSQKILELAFHLHDDLTG